MVAAAKRAAPVAITAGESARKANLRDFCPVRFFGGNAPLRVLDAFDGEDRNQTAVTGPNHGSRATRCARLFALRRRSSAAAEAHGSAPPYVAGLDAMLEANELKAKRERPACWRAAMAETIWIGALAPFFCNDRRAVLSSMAMTSPDRAATASMAKTHSVHRTGLQRLGR
jgi:hypothetical protein